MHLQFNFLKMRVKLMEKVLKICNVQKKTWEKTHIKKDAFSCLFNWEWDQQSPTY